MSENLEWKKLKPKFTIDPLMRTPPRRFKQRLNSANTSNLIAKANFNERIIEKDETSNLLDVIAKKVISDQKKIESAEPSMPAIVNCELLKSVFEEHETNNEEAVVQRETSNQSKLGFIPSNIEAALNSSDDASEVADEKKQPVNIKQLIPKEIFDEWLNECTSTAPSNVFKQNQKDRGIFPQTPSLSTCSKLILKNDRPPLDSFLQ